MDTEDESSVSPTGAGSTLSERHGNHATKHVVDLKKLGEYISDHIKA